MQFHLCILEYAIVESVVSQIATWGGSLHEIVDSLKTSLYPYIYVSALT